MRAWWMIPLLLAVPVSAHDGAHDCSQREFGAMNHLALWEPSLGPGESDTRTLGFDGCPLSKDWWMLFWVDAPEGLRFDLAAEGVHVGTWHGTDGVDVTTWQLPVTGFPELTITNTGNETTGARLYFDQTCDCTAKGAPVNGPVFLNADASIGETVEFGLRVLPFWPQVGNEPALPSTVEVRLTPMVALGGALRAVDDAAKTLRFDPATEPGCDPDVAAEGCIHIGWEATLPGKQILLVEVIQGAEDGWTVMVLPTIDVERQAPVPWWLAPLALVAVARQTLSRRGCRRD